MTQAIRLRGGVSTYLDDADYDRAKNYRWHKTQNGYAAGFVVEQGVRKRVYLHRWLLEAQPGQIVDHIDGNKLNNRRSNLRLVTRSQNQANRRHNRNSRSRYKGVTWHKRRGMWMARIQVRGRRITIGYFVDPLQAAYEYDAFARTFFGEYARVNFPHH
jgi:hypothetical protein